jgi:SAM-dependent methyltransferase
MNKILKKIILKLMSILRPNAKIDFIHKIKKNSSILDVGCGNDSPYITKLIQPHCFYTGIDIHDYNQNEKITADQYVIVNSNDFSDEIINLSSDFDVVISNHNLEHVVDPDKTLFAMLTKIKRNGYIFLAFPTEDSINFPSRYPTLNFYDDATHKYIPPSFDKVIDTIKDKGFEIEFSKKKYQPKLLFMIGLFLEPLSALLKKNLTGTWVYYGFESIIIAKKI